jgi:uncharacterized membrane protein HdeD (DUF308 family)
MTVETLERRAPVIDPAGNRIVMSALVRNWPLMAIRGVLAAVFGLALLGWPGITLPAVVTLFGAYAVVDGILALAASGRGALRVRDAWPVSLEGAISILLGGLALAAPLRVPRDFVIALALWGLITGILELIQAVRLPRTGAGYWLLGAGGLTSLSLAALLLAVPYAAAEVMVCRIGAYAVAFGAFVAFSAFAVSRSYTPD